MTAKKKPRRIALVGTAASCKEAPYNDPSWEIWGVAARCKEAVRATRWFELHRLDGEPPDWADKWRKCIKDFSHDVDLYMIYPEPDLGPSVIQYPVEHISRRFGTYFMTSSFAWMMALAIDELCPVGKAKIPGEIGIWGVDMEYGTEYKQQRAGFRHFVALAGFQGIAITRLASSGLAYEPIPYPLWQDDPLLENLTMRQRDTLAALEEADKSLKVVRNQLVHNEAVTAEVRSNGADPERLAKLERERADLLQTSSNLSRDITQHRGGYEEQCHLIDYLQP